MKQLVSALFVLALICLPAAAADPAHVKANLARQYTGTFAWDQGSSIQKVSITLEKTDIEGGSRVIAQGSGIYVTDGKTTHIQVRCAIDAATLRFEMWEQAPQAGPSDNFVTDGSHVGTISEDLKLITATWTTRGSGQRGALQLEAR